MNFSAGSMIARASSGSRSCSSSVEPLISAKSAVMVLRSPSDAFAEAALSSSTRTDAWNSVRLLDCERPLARASPHSSQNLAPGLLVFPHRGHVAANGAAHSLQNFALSRLSAPHLAQRILVSRSAKEGDYSLAGQARPRYKTCSGNSINAALRRMRACTSTATIRKGQSSKIEEGLASIKRPLMESIYCAGTRAETCLLAADETDCHVRQRASPKQPGLGCLNLWCGNRRRSTRRRHASAKLLQRACVVQHVSCEETLCCLVERGQSHVPLRIEDKCGRGGHAGFFVVHQAKRVCCREMSI